jgi:probable rRNA maturation factor
MRADRTRGPAAARSGGPEIVLQNPNRYPEAAARPLRPWLRSLVAALVPALVPEGCAASLGVRFASDREVRRWNRELRGKDRPTDVLSFPGEEEPAGEPRQEPHHIGDILISVPAARRQAEAAGHGVEREVKILLLHGLLHCLGHDHETDGGEMERLEGRLRRRWL